MKLILIFLFFISLQGTIKRHLSKKKPVIEIVVFVPENTDYVLPTPLLLLKNIKKKYSKDNVFTLDSYLGLQDITTLSDKKLLEPLYHCFLNCKKKWQKIKQSNNDKFFIFKWGDYQIIRGKKKIKSLFADSIQYLYEKYHDCQITIVALKNAGNFVTDSLEELLKKKIQKISNLVLLGTSIEKKIEQKITKKKSRGDYFFQTIYQIYSRGDIDQIKNIYLSFPFCKRKFSKQRKNLFNIDFSYIFSFSKNINTQLFYSYLPTSQDFIQSNSHSIPPHIFYYSSVIESVPEIIYKKNNFKFNTLYRKSKKI